MRYKISKAKLAKSLKNCLTREMIMNFLLTILFSKALSRQIYKDILVTSGDFGLDYFEDDSYVPVPYCLKLVSSVFALVS